MPALYPTNADPDGDRHLEKLTGFSGIWDLLKCPNYIFRDGMDASSLLY